MEAQVQQGIIGSYGRRGSPNPLSWFPDLYILAIEDTALFISHTCILKD
jgi:hypothetical protein